MTLRHKPNDVKQLAREAIALTIAGLDPTGGAGAMADLQVMGEHGIRGVIALTALTVQSTRRVVSVEAVSGRILSETLECLGQEEKILGIKIGMLASGENAGIVASWLPGSGVPRERVVLDPVLRSSSGAELLEPAGVRRLVEELLPVVGWVTPNVEELAVLSGGGSAPDRKGVPAMARELGVLARQRQSRNGGWRDPGLNIVVTGGHLDPPDDYLLEAGGRGVWFPGQRVEARGVHGSHGTGCAYSTALLCRLLLGDGAEEAVRGAKEWVVRRLEGASE